MYSIVIYYLLSMPPDWSVNKKRGGECKILTFERGMLKIILISHRLRLSTLKVFHSSAITN